MSWTNEPFVMEINRKQVSNNGRIVIFAWATVEQLVWALKVLQLIDPIVI